MKMFAKNIHKFVFYLALVVVFSAAAAQAAEERNPPCAPVSYQEGVTNAADGRGQVAAISQMLQSKPAEAAANCIEEGQTCTLHGTPCCGTYECKGTFPNTTCK